ncbi:MAG: glycosyltransferase [Isosphaeraceae bacterium]|nr:glycosyltransferase [Isosphaeraceae bacterium]
MTHDPLHLLFVEPRFPGRLGGLADWLVRCRGYRATFLCHSAEPPHRRPVSTGRGLEVIAYQVGGIAKSGAVAWTRILERGLCHAHAAWEVAEARRIRPVDIILGRSDGLGSTLFLPHTYPKIPILQYFDYYFHAHRHDLADDAELDPSTPDAFHQWRRAANASELIEFENGVHPWTASQWQRSLFPEPYRDDFLVLHEGIDTRLFRPDPAARAERTVAGRSIPREARVVTFVARSPDRLRGFDRFLEIVDRLQRLDPNVIAIAVGDPEVVHALDVEHHGLDYAASRLLSHPPRDPDRLWRIGSASPGMVARVLALSDLHIAPGRVFPPSRSTLEASATGAPVLATDHAPHREFFENDATAFLAPPEALADRAVAIWNDEELLRDVARAGAGATIARFGRDAALPRLCDRLLELVDRGS